MNRTLLFAALVALPASAQVQVQVNVPPPPGVVVHPAAPVVAPVPPPPPPTLVFPAPPTLVVVQPGIQVVEDHDEEVFFVNGHYWRRHGGHWYRAADHRGGWVYVEPRGVPGTIVRFAPGQYRRYKHGKAAKVVIDPPGPGKVKVKVKGGKHH